MSILEHALLHVRTGDADEFRDAMRKAVPLIEASDGFESIEVRPSAETSETFLLLVRWRSIDDHRHGFRTSARYQEWRALLHRFYDPTPSVGYFEDSFV